jgi:hypothetical protein
VDKQVSDGTPGQDRVGGYGVEGPQDHGEVGGPRVFEILGTAAVLDCLPRQRLMELAVAFGVWDEAPRRGRARAPDGGRVGSPLDALSKPELADKLVHRRSVTPRALWYALTTGERIKVLSQVPTL